jgi:hypothetical protein
LKVPDLSLEIIFHLRGLILQKILLKVMSQVHIVQEETLRKKLTQKKPKQRHNSPQIIHHGMPQEDNKHRH